MGCFEMPNFANGTETVAKALSETDAVTIIGGGDSAVGVQDAFVSGEAGQGDGFFVQFFRLNRVDLVEGLRGDAEGAAAEFILDVTASEEDNVAFSEYHAVGAVVDVQYDRGDLRVEFAQGLYEVVF